MKQAHEYLIFNKCFMHLNWIFLPKNHIEYSPKNPIFPTHITSRAEPILTRGKQLIIIFSILGFYESL